MKRIFFITLTALFFIIPSVQSDTLLKGPDPDTFPEPENCAKCHNIAKIYDELSQSSHSDMSCLECHVPGTAQKDKYKEADRSFYRLGYYEGHEKWLETTGNAVCLRCHTDRESETIENKCWECHMPVKGIDDFVLVKDKKLPPAGDNIKVHKKFSHNSHVFRVHPKTNVTEDE
jgi:Zn finger protein HypA/HybF involved in hydrogenase expression